jgi:hypothetical protein
LARFPPFLPGLLNSICFSFCAVKIGFTPQKERILHFSIQSEIPQGRQLFRNVMLDLAETLARMKLLRTQQKEPVVPEKTQIKLEDDFQPHQYLQRADAGGAARGASISTKPGTAPAAPQEESISTVVGRAVVFEEETVAGDGEGDEEQEAVHSGVCICHLGDSVKAEQLRGIFLQLAHQLGAEAAEMTKEGKGEFAMELTTEDGALFF